MTRSRAWIAAAALAGAACAGHSLQMSAAEVARAGNGDAIVIGSVQIEVEPRNQKLWRRLSGAVDLMDASRQWFRFELEAESSPEVWFQVMASARKDGVFVTRLPAGTYRFRKILPVDAAGQVDDRLVWPTRYAFTADAGEALYIGCLVMMIDEFPNLPPQVRLEVRDRRAETLEALEPEYGGLMTRAVTRLMRKP